MIYDNQASKLHQALLKLYSPHLANTQMLNVFADFFELDKNNPAVILENIAKLHKQILEIKLFCDGTTSLEKQFNKWSKPINQAFLSVNLLSRHSQFINNYTNDDLFLLDTTHDALVEKYQHYKIIDQQTLDELIQNLSNQLDAILQSDTSDKVKNYIQTQISTLIKNLKEYNLYGIKEIHQTIDSTIGHIITDEEYSSYIQQTSQGKSFLDELIKVGAVLQILECSTQITLNFQQLIQPFAG